MPPPGSDSLSLDGLNPYEIAYFRGERNEFVRLVTMRLLFLGVIREAVDESSGDLVIRLERVSAKPRTAELSPLELVCLNWFNAPLEPQCLFRLGGTDATVVAECEKFDEQLVLGGLINSEREFRLLRGQVQILAGIIAFVGSAVLSSGETTWGFWLIVGAVVLFLWNWPHTPRLTPRGLTRVQDLRAVATTFQRFPNLSSAVSRSGPAPDALLLALALCGPEILEGSPWESIAAQFDAPASLVKPASHRGGQFLGRFAPGRERL